MCVYIIFFVNVKRFNGYSASDMGALDHVRSQGLGVLTFMYLYVQVRTLIVRVLWHETQITQYEDW